jgi:single-stranded-DNA-specific exonuclease
VIVYVNSREQSVSIAGMLRGVSPLLSSRVAFYNGGVPRGLRHAIEAAFRTGDITAIVATSAFGEGVNIPDVRHVALLHLPFNRVEFNQMCGRAGRDGQPADVHVLFGERDAKLNELILESSAPDLDELRTLYASLRDRATASPDGWVEATNEELSQDVRKRRKGARLTDRGASSGIGVFRDLGLVAAEGIGQYRRLRVVPVEGKVDMASSLRYAEGLEEVEGFAEFRKWVLESEPDDLRRAFDRPIVPLSVRDAQAVG